VHRNLSRVIVAMGAIVALAVPAGAQEVFVPNTPLTQTYLECGGTTPEYFVNYVALDEETPTWSEIEPASVTTGAGCGMYDDSQFSGTVPDTIYDLNFGGTYSGNLDTLTVNLHDMGVGPARTGEDITLEVRVTIDGMSLFGVEENEAIDGTISASPAKRTVTVTPAAAASGVLSQYSFSIKDIDLLLETDDKEHDVQFTVGSYWENANTHEWVWGNSEAPTGVTFTPEALEADTLRADKRTNRKMAL
jgi:hypothetical protein